MCASGATDGRASSRSRVRALRDGGVHRRRRPPARARSRPPRSQGLLSAHEPPAALGGRRAAAASSWRRQPRARSRLEREPGPTDTLRRRDTGWIQLYCETNQEVLDTVLAFKLAETVDLPVMIVLDAFFLSHTSEPVDIPEPADGRRVPAAAHRGASCSTPTHRARSVALTTPAGLHGDAPRQQEAMEDARDGARRRSTWTGSQRFGRGYGAHRELSATAPPTWALVTSGTITSTSRHVVNELRDEDEGRAREGQDVPPVSDRGAARALAGVPGRGGARPQHLARAQRHLRRGDPRGAHDLLGPQAPRVTATSWARRRAT